MGGAGFVPRKIRSTRRLLGPLGGGGVRVSVKHALMPFLLFAGTAISAEDSTAFDAARNCFHAGKYQCAYEGFMTELERSPLALVGENDGLLVRGAELEMAFRKHADQNLELGETVEQADRFLSLTASTHPNTWRFLATGHLLRVTACIELDDRSCVQESIDVVCQPMRPLPLPYTTGAENFVMNDRFQALRDDFC